MTLRFIAEGSQYFHREAQRVLRVQPTNMPVAADPKHHHREPLTPTAERVEKLYQFSVARAQWPGSQRKHQAQLQAGTKLVEPGVEQVGIVADVDQFLPML